jgi:Spy/CpxP family protein refolding chaperone
MKKALIAVMAVFLVAAFASQSLGWWGQSLRTGRFDREKIAGRITKKLELTDEQKGKFEAYQKKMKEATSAHRKESEELAENLKRELSKDEPSETVVRSLVKHIGEKRTEMELKRLDSLFELRKVLTPEQRKKFKGMLNPGRTRSFGGKHKRR